MEISIKMEQQRKLQKDCVSLCLCVVAVLSAVHPQRHKECLTAKLKDSSQAHLHRRGNMITQCRQTNFIFMLQAFSFCKLSVHSWQHSTASFPSKRTRSHIFINTQTHWHTSCGVTAHKPSRDGKYWLTVFSLKAFLTMWVRKRTYSAGIASGSLQCSGQCAQAIMVRLYLPPFSLV